MCTPDGSGCALAAPGRGFASVADALRVGQALGAYLNSAAADGLDGPGRRRGPGALGTITSLLGAASNGLMRRFDAADDHDADGYATTAAWLAAKTRLGRRDAKAAVRQMRLLSRHPSLDAATATGASPSRGRGRSPPGPAASTTTTSSRQPTRSSSTPPPWGPTWTT